MGLYFGQSNRLIPVSLVALSVFISACESRTPSQLIHYDTIPDVRDEPITTFTGRTTIVKRGDNLYSIAFEAGFDTRDVARWNDMDQDDIIHPGQEIKLYPPPGEAPRKTFESTSQTSPAKTTSGSSVPTVSAKDPSKWSWPARGEIISRFSSQHRRNGISIGGSSGTPISAAAGGRVVYAGTGLIGYGRIIIVKHSEQFLSVYAHNSKVLVNEGDSVQQGQKIAEMGSTDAERVKLHFEIRRNGKPVNPLQYLPSA